MRQRALSPPRDASTPAPQVLSPVTERSFASRDLLSLQVLTNNYWCRLPLGAAWSERLKCTLDDLCLWFPKRLSTTAHSAS